MLVRVIPEPVIDEISLLIFSLIILSYASAKTSLFNFLALIFFDYFAIELTNDINRLVGRLYTSDGINSLGGPSIKFPNFTILDN